MKLMYKSLTDIIPGGQKMGKSYIDKILNKVFSDFRLTLIELDCSIINAWNMKLGPVLYTVAL